MELRWQVNESAGAFYAVECLLRGRRLRNQELAQTLADSAQRLQTLMGESMLPRNSFLAHLIPQAAEIFDNRLLATVIATKILGTEHSDELVQRMKILFDGVEAAFKKAAPVAGAQLSQAAQPLQDAWQSRGDLLLNTIARLAEPGLIVERANVILVYPACGGGGRPHLLYNAAVIEAVETDPVKQLPELLRLTWLLSQLNADLPMYQGEIHRDRLLRVATLAMIPPTLQAAAEHSLADFDEQTLAVALGAWLDDVAKPAEAADALWRWWHTYTAGRPAWPVAFQALDQMLG